VLYRKEEPDYQKKLAHPAFKDSGSFQDKTNHHTNQTTSALINRIMERHHRPLLLFLAILNVYLFLGYSRKFSVFYAYIASTVQVLNWINNYIEKLDREV